MTVRIPEMERADRASRAARLASFLRGLRPPGASARLHLVELSSSGVSLLSLETRGDEGEWTRRVQLPIEPTLVAPLVAEL